MLKLNSDKAVHVKYKKFKELVKYIVCVCDLHPTENTLIQLPFVCLNTLVIFFYYQHTCQLSTCTHITVKSWILIPHLGKMLKWFDSFLESLSFPESCYLFFYFFIEAACVASLCSVLTAPEFNIWNMKSLIYL